MYVCGNFNFFWNIMEIKFDFGENNRLKSYGHLSFKGAMSGTNDKSAKVTFTCETPCREF